MVEGEAGSTMMVTTGAGLGRPSSTTAQEVPAFVVLNTPSPAPAVVPAYSVDGVDGSMAREAMRPPCGPWLVQTLVPARATDAGRPRMTSVDTAMSVRRDRTSGTSGSSP